MASTVDLNVYQRLDRLDIKTRRYATHIKNAPKAIMLRLTLDTNCLIDLEQHSAQALFLNEIVTAHHRGSIKLCVVAISASERLKDGKFAENFSAFENKLAELNLSSSKVLIPLFYWDITFWDHCLCGDNDSLELQIHEILFPNLPFLWADYCDATGVNTNAITSDRKWRNAKCDVLALWSHIHYKADAFVTSDLNFHKVTKRPHLIALGAKEIFTPEQAATFIR